MKTSLTILMAIMGVCSFAMAKPSASVDIRTPRVFAPLKGSNATAGYGFFQNTTNENITLTIEKAEGFKAVELHESLMTDGRMSMKKVDSITIKPSEFFEMKPGGHHIMLFDPTKDFKEGDLVKVTFKVNGKSEVREFKIESRVKKEESQGHHHHH